MTTPPPSNHDAILINLHIAEYQALTTRCTYWITMHFALLSVIPIYLTVVAAIWFSGSSIDRRLLFWGSGLILQTLGWIWMQTQGEQYLAVLYMEEVLRPAVKRVINKNQFWCYEPYLAKLRVSTSFSPLISPSNWEFPPVVIATLMVVGAFIYISRSGAWVISGYGWVGLVLYLLFLILLWWKTISLRSKRTKFSTKALASGCLSEDT